MNPSLKAAIRREKRAVLDILDAAASEGRGVTDEEKARADQHIKSIRELARRGLDQDELHEQLKEFGSIHSVEPGYQPGGPTKTRLGAVWANAVTKDRDGYGLKSLAPSGAVLVPVPAPEPIGLGQPVLTMRQLIPAEPTAGRFSWLRQTLRTNNAAPVAPGAKKPTSIYETELVEDRARVIAHLSSPLSKQDLADSEALASFLDAEMRYGLEAALENQILSGSGVGENLTGLASTSGFQTQAYDTSLIVTTRKAVTKLETQGLAGTGWVLNPADWEAIELSATGTGSLLMTEAGQRGPVEPAARRLWGQPVVTSVACPAGTGWYADWAGSTKLFLREDVQLDWSEAVYDPNRFGVGDGGSLFEANQVVWRAELRAGFGVLRPSGVVQVDLTA